MKNSHLTIGNIMCSGKVVLLDGDWVGDTYPLPIEEQEESLHDRLLTIRTRARLVIPAQASGGFSDSTIRGLFFI